MHWWGHRCLRQKAPDRGCSSFVLQRYPDSVLPARKAGLDAPTFFLGTGAGGCTGSGMGNGSASFSLLSLPSNSAAAAFTDIFGPLAGLPSRIAWFSRGPPRASWPDRALAQTAAFPVRQGSRAIGRQSPSMPRTGTASPRSRGRLRRGIAVFRVQLYRPFQASLPITASRSRTRSSRSAARRGPGSAGVRWKPQSPTAAPLRSSAHRRGDVQPMEVDRVVVEDRQNLPVEVVCVHEQDPRAGRPRATPGCACAPAAAAGRTARRSTGSAAVLTPGTTRRCGSR